MEQTKYKAFISYRHVPQDSAIAEKLVPMLETYRPPRNLHIKREKIVVFRDKDELPLSNDLNQDIKTALENSEYLIVVCSPALTDPSSKWCQEEIRYFKELHNGNTSNIITVLAAGTPATSFPDELKTSVNQGKEKEVEPLAADIAADDAKGSLQLLKTEYLRILARFYEVSYDKLYQREKKRAFRKRLAITGSVTSVLLTIAVITTLFSVQLFKRNRTISRLYAETLGEEAELLWTSGQYYPAIEKSVEALSTDSSSVAGKAVSTLSQAMEVFNETAFLPRTRLNLQDAVLEAAFVDNGKTVFAADINAVYFFDAETGRLKKRVANRELGKWFTHKGHHAKLLCEKGGWLYLADSEGFEFCCVDGRDLSVVSETEISTRSASLQLQSDGMFLFSGGPVIKDGEETGKEFFRILSLETEETVLSNISDSRKESYRDFYFDPARQLLLCTRDNQILAIRTDNGEWGAEQTLYTCSLQNVSSVGYSEANGNLIFIFTGGQKEEIVSIGIDNLQADWHTVLQDKPTKNEAVAYYSPKIRSGCWFPDAQQENGGVLFLSREDTVSFLSVPDGRFLYSEQLDSTVLWMAVDSENRISVMTQYEALRLKPEALFQEKKDVIETVDGGFIRVNADAELAFDIAQELYLSRFSIAGPVIIGAAHDGDFLTATKDSTVAHILSQQQNEDYLPSTELFNDPRLPEESWMEVNPYGTEHLVVGCHRDPAVPLSAVDSFYCCSLRDGQPSPLSAIASSESLSFEGYLPENIACFSKRLPGKDNKYNFQLMYYDMANKSWTEGTRYTGYISAISEKYIFTYQYGTNDEKLYILRHSPGEEAQVWEPEGYQVGILRPSPDGSVLAMTLTEPESGQCFLGLLNYDRGTLQTIEIAYNFRTDVVTFLGNDVVAVSNADAAEIVFADVAGARLLPQKIDLNDPEQSASPARVTQIFYLEEKDALVVVHQDDVLERCDSIVSNLRSGIAPVGGAHLIIETLALKNRQVGHTTLAYHSSENVMIVCKNTKLIEDSEAWILSYDNLEVLFHINQYWDYSPELQRIFVRGISDDPGRLRTNFCGSFPYYSAEDLCEKANHLLEKTGSSPSASAPSNR